MKPLIRWLASGCALLYLTAVAQTTPEGLWATYDDQHNQVQSWVRIERRGEFLQGVIEKLLDPTAAPDETCDACKGHRKGLPLKGLTIIEGLPVVAQSGKWKGGKILDPESGDEYRLELEMLERGQVLLVRGFWGPFWRSQRWVKVKP